MKRRAAVGLLLAILLAWGGGGVASATPTAKLSICLEAADSLFLKGIVEYYRDTHPEVPVETIWLPTDKDDRSKVLHRVRNDIKRGTGPDVFVLPGKVRGENALFYSMDSVLRAGVLRDLTSFLHGRNLLKDLNAGVVEAGVINDQITALPLGYTLSGIVTSVETLERHGIDKEEAQKDRTSFLNSFAPLSQIYLGSYFESLRMPLLTDFADVIANKSTLLRSEVFGNSVAFADSISMAVTDESQVGICDKPLPLLGGTLGTKGQLIDQAHRFASTNQASLFVPLPNEKGGITARVSMWAGVSSTCSKTGEAMEFIECLLMQPFQRGDGTAFQMGDKEYAGQSNGVGFPVRKGHLIYAASTLPAGITKSLVEIEDRINFSRFETGEEYVLAESLLKTTGSISMDDRLLTAKMALARYEVDQIQAELALKR